MWRSSLFVLIYFVVMTEQRLFCRDEDGTVVDWFVGYKLPHFKHSSNKLIQGGVAYSYITSRDVASGWKLSTRSVNNTLSILGQTLLPLYTNTSSAGASTQPDLLWILYNDQPPKGNVSFNKGHTKGVVMCQPDGGVWLVHSIPHYPPSPTGKGGGYSYPHSGLTYGQSFLCLSLDLKQMDLVGLQLTYNEPFIYNHALLPNLPAPNLLAAAEGRTVVCPPWFHQAHIATQQGSMFTSFAKAARFHKDLYADWVAVALRSDLLVESWLNGENPLPSSCTRPYTVQNVAAVSMSGAGVKFSTHDDHSKWAVSINGTEKTWVCVGDINRMVSQEQRGGGTVCIQDPHLWVAYRRTVSCIAPCA